MDIERIREYCLGKKGATEGFPFDETNLVIKVMNKMFILIPLDTPDRFTVKCDPELAIDLRERHPEKVIAAYHFNKKYWNSILFELFDDQFIREQIDHSYNEVVKKLTLKERKELGY